MALLKKKKPTNFYDLPEKKQRELMLKAAKYANKQQKALEIRYNKLQTQK
jgi:diadenosine tetraphosphate (Ap4A) HIT family hydrolase